MDIDLFHYIGLIQFVDAQDRLNQLDKEKQILDDQLKQAHNKIRVSEDNRELLEARLRQVTPFKEGDKIRRVHSFMPSTKERPIMLEVRAATLRRPSKQWEANGLEKIIN